MILDQAEGSGNPTDDHVGTAASGCPLERSSTCISARDEVHRTATVVTQTSFRNWLGSGFVSLIVVVN
jgi:hypothetical protein